MNKLVELKKEELKQIDGGAWYNVPLSRIFAEWYSGGSQHGTPLEPNWIRTLIVNQMYVGAYKPRRHTSSGVHR